MRNIVSWIDFKLDLYLYSSCCAYLFILSLQRTFCLAIPMDSSTWWILPESNRFILRFPFILLFIFPIWPLPDFVCLSAGCKGRNFFDSGKIYFEIIFCPFLRFQYPTLAFQSPLFLSKRVAKVESFFTFPKFIFSFF